MLKTSRYSRTQTMPGGYKVLKAKKAKRSVNITENYSNCPDCDNKVFFVEAGFLCPVCGCSTETLFNHR